MGMRLLKKSEVDQAKVTEQQTAVMEGAKIARSVDTLREIRADEERSLEEFRVKSIEAIHVSIKEETEKLNLLKKEVQDLEDRKAEALKPLESQKSALDAYATTLDERERCTTDTDRRLEAQRADIRTSEQALEERERRLEHWDAASFAALRDAAERERETKRLLVEAQDMVTAAERTKRDTLVELTHREEGVLRWEERATVRETEQNVREADYTARMTLLKDREEMVERDLQRIKK